MDDKACLISRLVISVVSMSVCVYSLIQIIKIHRMDKKRNEAFNISCKKIEACMRISAKKHGNEEGAELDSYDLSEEELLRYEKIVIEKDLNIELISLNYFNTLE